jgi:endonuclease YncB( thermonuclease family)
MEQRTGNRTLILGTIALTVICAGLLCLALGPALGILALRRVSASSASPSSNPSESALFTKQGTEPVSQPKYSATATASLTPAISQTPPAGTQVILTPTIMQFQAATSSSPRTTQTAVSSVLTSSPQPTSPPLAMDAWCVPWNSGAVRAYVMNVIDGVTIEVSSGGGIEQIRYIGIDMLEYTNEPEVWAAMTEKNRSLVEGKQALLIEGGAGGYEGDLPLRYVIVDDTFVNLELVQSGYAIAKSTPPFTSCDEVFAEAEIAAIADKRGLWAPDPTPTRTLIPPTPTVSPIGDVVVIKVFFLGTFWQEPDEFVEIYNSGTLPVQLEGWSLSDNQRHVFVYPNFVLGSNQYCRVYTNQYQPQNCGFSYFKPSPIWDNGGDCAYLKDSTGRLVDTFCYE